MENNLILLYDATKRMGVTPTTVRTWEKEDKIQVERTKGGHRRVLESEIERINEIRKPYLDFVKGKGE